MRFMAVAEDTSCAGYNVSSICSVGYLRRAGYDMSRRSGVGYVEQDTI
jgi:hypothetical protein